MPRRLLLLLCLLAIGCPKRVQIAPPTDAKTGLDQALASLEAKRYKETEDRLTFIIFNFPGSRQAADAQYFLGETYFQSRDYEQAQTEFDFYLKSFPNGSFQEQASYKLGLSYFYAAPKNARDQADAVKAREILEDFLAEYPESELKSTVEAAIAGIDRRVTGQDLNVALLYFKAGEFKAALTYYEYVAGKLAPGEWQSEDRLRLGICYQETGQPDKARAVFEALVAGDCPEEVRRKAAARLARLK